MAQINPRARNPKPVRAKDMMLSWLTVIRREQVQPKLWATLCLRAGVRTISDEVQVTVIRSAEPSYGVGI